MAAIELEGWAKCDELGGAERAEEILDYFHDSFTLYESIFECLAVQHV